MQAFVIRKAVRTREKFKQTRNTNNIAITLEKLG